MSVLSLAAKEKMHGLALPRQAWEIVRRLVDEAMGSLVYDFLDVTKVTLNHAHFVIVPAFF